MEIVGALNGLSRVWQTDQVLISFTIDNESVLREIEKYKNSKLSIKVSKYREKRSLDANAYFHVLAGKIADELRISKQRAKNILIGRYGQPELLDDGSQAVIKTNIPVTQMLEQETLHCSPCGSKIEQGTETYFYRICRGSHTYNTKEMSILIDGTVEEAKDLGIETLTPDQLQRIKALWGKKNG